ncbi:MAG TPA: flagellar biosynthesis anti-sigma factor FlgM, partial [Phycisphaerales bacterium]|nr:flagellar biosynthesis anti-sigma factor FlgM [Phycisphaerales bacterium]
MTEIGSISGGNGGLRPGVVGRIQPRETLSSPPAGRAETDRDGDTVEVSDVARVAAAKLIEPPIRQELVRSVREAIDAGTYITDSKLESAVGQ